MEPIETTSQAIINPSIGYIHTEPLRKNKTILP